MSNINESLAKRKAHHSTNAFIGPLCGLSPEVPRYDNLYSTPIKSEVTCKRCIRSLTGRYDR